jgi:signal transduction histidine kinase
MTVKKLSFLSLLIGVSCLVFGQEYFAKDELLRKLSQTPEDTNRVLLYISLGQQYENNQPDSAIHYYLLARDLSEQLEYVTGILKYYSNITYVYNMQGKYDTALLLNLKSVDLARTHGNDIQLAACLGNVASCYLYLEKYEKAISYYLEGSKLFQESGNTQYQCINYSNLCVIYIKLKQPEKAKEFAEKAVALAREIDDQYNLGVSLGNLGLSLMKLQNLREAIVTLEECLKVSEQTDNLYVKEAALINLADIYRRFGDYDKLKTYADEGLALARDLEDLAGEGTASLSLGYFHLYHSKYDLALSHARLAERNFSSLNMLEELANAYALVSQVYLFKKDHKLFHDYEVRLDSVEQLTINEQVLKNTQELEAIYENEKKALKIHDLEQEFAISELKLAKSRFFMITLGGIIFTIIIVGTLLIRSYRQKQLIMNQEKELQNKRINELETEKLLAAAEAALKGQDDERTRLARDLHDGLGGMLSGIKLSFLNLKETLGKNKEHHQRFDRSIDMLDGSVTELRRVAHNLMPETLLKFGLDTAIRDYCDRISDSGTLKISYQSINLQNMEADQTAQITIYRIVQELVNNIIKHAGATNVNVQLANHDDHFTICVEDDGDGFDIEKVNNSQGIGWRNIQNRIAFLKGNIDIQSEEKKGTTINIELLI